MLKFDLGQHLPVLLLIDDDMISREVTATVLTIKGYQIFTAESGLDALHQLAKEACMPDVILMDVQMPGLSGVSLIEALRQRAKAKIVTVSACPPPAEVVAAADGFLLKPFDAAALVELLRRGKQGEGQVSASAQVDASVPVVNQTTLKQLRSMMSSGAVNEIYTAVVADLNQRAEALELAIGGSNLAEVRRIGHAIKGGCGMAGAAEAAHIGALLENSDQLDNSASLLRELRAATTRLERILKEEFQRS